MIRSRRSPGEVWELLLDPRRGPFWQAAWQGKTRYSLKSEQRGWRQASSGPSSFVMEVEEAVEPEMLRLRLQGSLQGTWTIRLLPEAGGTRIVLEEYVAAAPGLGNWMRRFAKGNEAGEFLKDLSARLGESA